MVHVHNVVASVVTRIAAKIAGVSRIVYTAHGFPFHPGGGRLKNLVFMLAEKIMGFFTDYLIVMNSWDFHMALKMKIVKPDNLFKTNGVGVDINKFKYKFSWETGTNFQDGSGAKKYREMLKLEDSAKVIGCVAELISRKNHEMIIDSAREVLQTEKDAVYLFVGSGSNDGRLKKIIKEKGLEEYQ
jgi:glycosyltransferase involved in cell wall biosynthesis